MELVEESQPVKECYYMPHNDYRLEKNSKS